MSGFTDVLHLLNRKRLRAIYLAIRQEEPQFDSQRSTDSELVDLATEPYQTIPEVEEHLGDLETELQAREDRRAVFLTIYTKMTRAVRDRIEAGGFENPEWMREYTVTFANYYRRAFLAFEQGRFEEVPTPWQLAFGTAMGRNTLIVQDAFLGINAHINYDLALAIRETGIDPDRQSKRADHYAINEVLEKIINSQQRALSELYAPGVENVDTLFGTFDESFALFTMAEGRDQAWNVAKVLTDSQLPGVGALSKFVLNWTATGGAVFVLAPAVDRSLLESLEAVEQDQVELADALQQIRFHVDNTLEN